MNESRKHRPYSILLLPKKRSQSEDVTKVGLEATLRTLLDLSWLLPLISAHLFSQAHLRHLHLTWTPRVFRSNSTMILSPPKLTLQFADVSCGLSSPRSLRCISSCSSVRVRFCVSLSDCRGPSIVGYFSSRLTVLWELSARPRPHVRLFLRVHSLHVPPWKARFTPRGTKCPLIVFGAFRWRVRPGMSSLSHGFLSFLLRGSKNQSRGIAIYVSCVTFQWYSLPSVSVSFLCERLTAARVDFFEHLRGKPQVTGVHSICNWRRALALSVWPISDGPARRGSSRASTATSQTLRAATSSTVSARPR